MRLLKNITIGADPEVFIRHNNGKIIPAFLFLPDNDKSNPKDVGNGYYILHDNVTLEGNIPPASTKEEFIKNLDTLIQIFRNELASKNSNLSLHYADSAELEEVYLAYPAAKIFGCSPFNNAYGNDSIVAPNLEDFKLRVSGFHNHIGYDSYYNKEKINPLIAKMYDIFVVVPSRMKSSDTFREKYYGALGSYRDKPYGLEVRSLGGFFFNPEYHEKIYDNIMMMVDYINHFNDINQLIQKTNLIDPYNIKKYLKRIYRDLDINLDLLTFK